MDLINVINVNPDFGMINQIACAVTVMILMTRSFVKSVQLITSAQNASQDLEWDNKVQIQKECAYPVMIKIARIVIYKLESA